MVKKRPLKTLQEKEKMILNLFQTSPGFYMFSVEVFLKTRWGKGEIVTSNSSLSHSVFYLFGELPAIFIKFKFVVCKLFQFGTVLTHSHTMTSVDAPGKQPFENAVGKRGNCS